jgi:hypothetical protein
LLAAFTGSGCAARFAAGGQASLNLLINDMLDAGEVDAASALGVTLTFLISCLHRCSSESLRSRHPAERPT